MLDQANCNPTLAVKDLAAAREFYENVLGLTVAMENEEADSVAYSSGENLIMVYRSDFAGTNKATACGWSFPDAEAAKNAIAHLRGKGVEFMTFDAPDMEWDDGVATMPDGNVSAWFADPDGNILAVGSFMS